jgi:CheY-like chemotaxis protein
MTTKTILVINSESSIQEIMEAYLSHPRGWRVIKAASSLEGLDWAAQIQPDAILFDVATFGMNFFTFLKRLRSQEQNQHTPVILLAEKRWLDDDLLQQFQIKGVIDYYCTHAASIPQEIAQLLNWDEVPQISGD